MWVARSGLVIGSACFPFFGTCLNLVTVHLSLLTVFKIWVIAAFRNSESGIRLIWLPGFADNRCGEVWAARSGLDFGSAYFLPASGHCLCPKLPTDPLLIQDGSASR
jgi:hypothetical protein